MKMSIASIAVALVYLLSIVAADHQLSSTMTISDQGGNTNKIILSTDGRMQLAQTIKEMMGSSPEAGPAGAMTTEDLIGFLSGLASNPAVLSNAAGIISSAASGNTGALAGHVVGLLGAALPAATPAPAVETPAPVTPTLYAAPAAAPAEIPSTSA